MTKERKLKFVVTGFNSFHGVDDNPSAMLAQDINSGFYKFCDEELSLSVILNVAADDVKQWIVGQQHKMASKDLTDDAQVIWLHMGVNIKAECFTLETRAANNATFRCPDNKGWCPQNEKIEPNKPLNSHLYSDLDVEQITACLRLKNFDVELSDDAGKFVCNWIYYLSLQDSLQFPGKWHSLFVHVPPLDVYTLQQQEVFLKSLIQQICISLGCQLDQKQLISSIGPQIVQPQIAYA
eukprot:TRINITY_DN6413_c0_g1_i1.p1 TRINITY_DN6413_c0_g1~~TRINITY_DN6413_c0_g1_i1.p1  ORF type:complete len:238 (-),score=21.88 TRINITY_DN6413_c0_g1_i1:386-1099(-)